MKKKSIILLVTLLVMAVFTGCSTIQYLFQGEFDASGYVKGILDASYKGEFEKYIELTEDTPESAQEAYDAIMNSKAENFATYTAVDLTDETKAKFVEYSKQIYKNAKYEVSKATKTDQGFTVDISISPMTILQTITTEGEAFVEEFNTRNTNGEFAEYTDEEFQNEYNKGIMEIFDRNVANIQYEEPVTVTVSVVLDGEKLYTMQEEEYTKIDSAMLKQ